MDEHRLGGAVLRRVHVVPEFVSEAEARALLRALEGRRWAQAKGRRIQELGGPVAAWLVIRWAWRCELGRACDAWVADEGLLGWLCPLPVVEGLHGEQGDGC